MKWFKNNWLSLAGLIVGLTPFALTLNKKIPPVTVPLYVLSLVFFSGYLAGIVIYRLNLKLYNKKNVISLFKPGVKVKHKTTHELMTVVKAHPLKKDVLVCSNSQGNEVNISVTDLLMMLSV